MASHKYLIDKTEAKNSFNVVNLLKLAKLEKKKEKRRDILLAVVAMSALTLSGLIISL